jgi:hypothetical protein
MFISEALIKMGGNTLKCDTQLYVLHIDGDIINNHYCLLFALLDFNSFFFSNREENELLIKITSIGD